jgi:hypothetical protein
MSSATSTKPHPDDERGSGRNDTGMQAWQFFVLAALGCATAATFMARGQGFTVVVLLSVLMGTAAIVGLAMLRTLYPLVSHEEDRTVMIGQRTRAALEREKLLTLRAIKEVEFDRAMGKLSDEDFREMAGRLRARAAGLIRHLDAGAGYREQIERDLAKKLETDTRFRAPGPASAAQQCAACAALNDHDARFCKQCGARL